MSDNDYSPAERAYFEPGDASGALAEQGRHPAPPEPDGGPQLSDAEECYFRSGGNVGETDADQLRREQGFSRPTEYERDPQPSSPAHGVTLAQRRRTRPEISVETKLNGVDVLPVRPEGRFGLPIEPPSE